MDAHQQHLAMTGGYMSAGIDLHAMAAVQPLPPQVDASMGMGMAAAGDMLGDVKLGPEPASPAPSSASSKEKWQQKRHVCDTPDCGKSFDSKWALIRCGHVDVDASCCLCGLAHVLAYYCTKSFKGKDYLEFHLKIHAEGDPYACDHPTCSKTFCSPKSLKKHIRLWHNPGGKSTSMEQQLRERIIKMATRNKEKTRKFEATIRTLMEENEALKRRILELEGHQQQM
ncbi:unnamed protein product [Phytophthora lilii]|uniref:Unnamed protein product n=1 Tax=Phytophthora lilii TaxID=2077276 RepID=A0A9W6UC07_9STRA|nr:unnamed protein product [Phytophthora lilii]